MTLLIMAAGMGSRFGGLKQIEPVGPNGEFIIDYSVYDAKLAGFDKVVFIIKEENYEIFKDTIGKRFENIIDVEYVFQKNDDVPYFVKGTDRIKPWGTGHAILAAKNTINENFGVINADDFYGRDAYFKLADFLRNSKENEFATIGYNIYSTTSDAGSVKRGVIFSENDELIDLKESLIEKKDNTYLASPLNGSTPFEVSENTLTSVNMFGFSKSLFDYLEKDMIEFFKENIDDLSKCEYLIPDVVKDMILKKMISVKVIPTSATWMGITYKEDKQSLVDRINTLIKDGTYPEHLTEKN